MRWKCNLPFRSVHCSLAFLFEKKPKPVKTLERVEVDGMLLNTFPNVSHIALLKIFYHKICLLGSRYPRRRMTSARFERIFEYLRIRAANIIRLICFDNPSSQYENLLCTRFFFTFLYSVKICNLTFSILFFFRFPFTTLCHVRTATFYMLLRRGWVHYECIYLITSFHFIKTLEN